MQPSEVIRRALKLAPGASEADIQARIREVVRAAGQPFGPAPGDPPITPAHRLQALEREQRLLREGVRRAEGVQEAAEARREAESARQRRKYLAAFYESQGWNLAMKGGRLVATDPATGKVVDLG